MTINISNGDCLTLMKDIPDKSVDLFICDLPYGETNCKWDSKIDLVEFWKEFKRIRKSKRTACIHFCSTKFGYTLIKSNEKMFKMDMVWKKRNKTGGLQSRNRPMRNHEMVYFFYEQAPKYNRDKYHKRIQAVKKHDVEQEEKPKRKTIKDRKAMCEPTGIYSKQDQTATSFDPPNPASVVEEKTTYGISKEKAQKSGRKDFKGIGTQNAFEPPNPASVLESPLLKDNVYGKACGGGGFGSKEYYKIRKEKGEFEPPNPASVVEENHVNVYGFDKSHPTWAQHNSFDPPNPASVVEEKEEKPKKKLRDKTNSTRAKEGKDIFGNNDTNVKPFNYDPPNPASVLEANDDKWIKEVGKNGHGWNKHKPEYGNGFEPPNPASVISEAEKDVWGETKFSCGGDCGRLNEDGTYKMPYDPPNPPSVFESTKVFIGKRHHQTEKPQDILEFFIKYWTDEGQTILDPTMGSGSTGVACKTLKRNFIGFEKDEKIYKVAEERIKKVETII